MFDFKVVPDSGEPYDLTADSRDVYLWERTTKGKNLVALRDSLAMGDLYRLAHFAAKRTGRYASTFDEFVEEHAIDLQDEEEEEEPDPTPPAP